MLYLAGLVIKSPEELGVMAPVAVGVVVAALAVSGVFTKVVGTRVREQVERAARKDDPEALPEQ